MPRLVHITTVPKSLLFLRDQIAFMRAKGFEVQAITSPGDELTRFARELDLEIFPVDMPRRISPLEDLAALARMSALLRRLRPDIVHSHTPKGGLLGTISAALAGTPSRVYHMRGLPLMTATGKRRELLKWTERVSCALAHKTIAVSHSLREVALDEHLCRARKIEVLLGGSGQGVDAAHRFDPARWQDQRAARREQLGIPQDAVVVGFVGRLVRDKGIVELANAWNMIHAAHPGAHLLLIGDYEARDPVPDTTREQLKRAPRVHHIGWQNDVAPYYAAMDLVTLPSYREGFPNVPLEAASMELAVITTDVAGCRDAVQDGLTGKLIPAADARALASALTAYLKHPDQRLEHGLAGRQRALAQFDPQKIFAAMHDEIYLPLLSSR